MSSSTIVQQIAQQNLRNLIRDVALNKWATVNGEYLSLIASLINQKIDTTAMIRGTYGHMWGAYSHSMKEPIRKMIDTVKKLTEKDITAQVMVFFAGKGKDLTNPVAQLKNAPLEDKRTYLRAASVISTPVAAAYLGVTTAAVNKFTAEHYHAIGDRYARGYCLSMDELFLIEQNEEWLVGALSENDVSEVKVADDRAFDYLLHVGEDVACAFTNMKPSELRKAVKAGAQTMRPYRLADLEKIRVAKLNSSKV